MGLYNILLAGAILMSTITSIYPSWTRIWTPVTITGTGFVYGSTVTIGGVACETVVYVNATTYTAYSPHGIAAGDGSDLEGAKDVVMTNPDTSTATLTNGLDR